MKPLIFLKLGGSLITNKNQPHTPRMDRIHSVLNQINQFHTENPQVPIILGHGSGSFGHVPAHQYDTRNGVHTPEEWSGFTKVWAEARALNSILQETCGMYPSLDAISLPVSASTQTSRGVITHWNLYPIQQALAHDLIPIVYGDVVFDTVLGGSILSTEEIFSYLAKQLHPQKILVAGIETGVYRDFPQNTQIFDTITPDTYLSDANKIKGSLSTDVTGGMYEKVRLLLDLCISIPELQYGQIFSGMEENAVLKALNGIPMGTIITHTKKEFI